MRNLLIFLTCLCLGLVSLGRAETITLVDGTTLTGDIVKFDDNGLLLRMTGDVYTNPPWARFSQATLKQLAEKPKIRLYVEPFIEPDISKRPPKVEIQVNPVNRLAYPSNPSIFGGLLGTPLGLTLMALIYLANLYAGFEVSVIRARPALQVVGISAVLPVLGPIIFLFMPTIIEKPPEEPNPSSVPPAGLSKPKEEAQIMEASWKQEEKKDKTQVFARGKFTFNKRFVETKFADFIGTPKGEALKFTMHLKCNQGEFAIQRIAQVNPSEVIFETLERGQLPVPLIDIQEIRLTPIPA